MTQPQHVITLPPLEYQFLQELMNRVTREGLLVPDELPYAASLWTRIRQAQVVEIPEPEEQQFTEQAGPAPDTEGSNES